MKTHPVLKQGPRKKHSYLLVSELRRDSSVGYG